MLTFDYNIPPTLKGAKYFMIITDDYSRYRWFFALKRKSDAKKVLEDWITMIQTQFYKTPKRIRTDCDKEWLNKILSKFATKKGIQ
jgi:Integrase core domain